MPCKICVDSIGVEIVAFTIVEMMNESSVTVIHIVSDGEVVVWGY